MSYCIVSEYLHELAVHESIPQCHVADHRVLQMIVCVYNKETLSENHMLFSRQVHVTCLIMKILMLNLLAYTLKGSQHILSKAIWNIEQLLLVNLDSFKHKTA